jgi:CheY-like chemotaxis protein
MMAGTPFTILLTEDDDGHAALTRRNIERAGFGGEVVRLRDGQELLDSLCQERDGSLTGRRLVVLLDIRMPKVDGFEALSRIKSNPRTQLIPVYMFTTTDNPAEISRAFRLGCNAWVTKPVAYEAFASTVGRLCEFLKAAQVPEWIPES